MIMAKPTLQDTLFPAHLPKPNAAAQTHSLALAQQLRDKIDAADGNLPFDQFMQEALYAPGLGYYSAGATKIGTEGDFTTGPELSPLFGRCVAQTCASTLQQIGMDGCILEFGPGTGKLAVDVLLQLAKQEALPNYYYLLDLSPDLKQRQHDYIHAHLPPAIAARVTWINELPAHFDGIMLANEVLDAMPVSVVQRTNEGWKEGCISWNEQAQKMNWAFTPKITSLLTAATRALEDSHIIRAWPATYTTELSLQVTPWLNSLSQHLNRGAILLIDYGYPAHEYYHPQRSEGTLMCHYQHQAHTDPLILPGLQDITAHVDFSAVAQAALDNDLELSGYTTQAFYLINCGLEQLHQSQTDLPDAALHTQRQAIKRLTLPHEMGELFKAMLLTRHLDTIPTGFALMDQRHRLGLQC